MQTESARFLDREAAHEDPAPSARDGDGGVLANWLATLADEPAFRGALAHWERIPERPAQFAELEPPLNHAINDALAHRSIERLYTHQVRAIESLRARRDTVVVTGTASGKSLCYQLPVFESLLDSESTALFLYPTKALAQDQLKGLTRLATGHPDLLKVLNPGVYDGDTQPATRRKIRDSANVVLSNPDMLHQGILPAHTRWGRFLRNLRYVVIDEMHTYRGVFGSHVANVLRRLERVVKHVGGDFSYVLCSATIRNPGELAHALTGRNVEVVDQDGAPRGEKHFLFWNPPYIDESRVERRSSNVEGCELFTRLIEHGAQVLAFTKSRVAAELVYRYAHDTLEQRQGGMEKRIKPYRGGYLPEERRAIEKSLFSGELRGVVSTNALELGVDIGGLDAVVMIGAPPTRASAWQQAGRAGRKGEAAVAILVAYNETVDQYLMRHPDYFFGSSPEAAVVDPHNPYILAQQLACAAYEIPLDPSDHEAFGAQTPEILAALEAEGEMRTIDDRSYWAKTEFPAARVNLRTISDNTYTIMDVGRDHAVMGTVDAISALELVYPEAIYLHDGDTFFVRELDLEQKAAYVERREVDYYTSPVLDTQIRVRGETDARHWRGENVRLGEVTYAWQTVAMKKVKFKTLDSIGYHPLELPRLTLDTTGFWLCPHPDTWKAVARQGLNPIEGLSGVRNLFLTLLSMISMCDPYDLGGMIDSSNLGRPTLFIFDRYPGGLGFAEQGWARLDELAQGAYEHLETCPCSDGCPSCVGMPILRVAQQQDPDLGRARAIPGKAAARALLQHWLQADAPPVEGESR
jgi:DEAD/DEAH box helicase domain-containing protein